ncbi:MAG TPA: SDR family oxidoreductase [Actinomycetota bacterium]|nr:SDR family oxidoreductase [Actinomycetota bacterium]
MPTGAGNAQVVAVTGVSGYLGRRLLRALDDDPMVERVVGLDVAEPHAGSPKLEFHQIDVRDARLVKILPGVDVVVHLAFQFEPIRDAALTRAINVDGTRNVLEGAGATGVRKLIHVSSATVYGAHPDNDFPLTESSPLRANPDFAYAWHKLEAERMIEAFQEDHPEVVVTVLRPAIVFGPNVQNFISRMLEAPRVTTVKGYEPPLQLVHEEDVASAIHFAIERDMPGAFNVSADGWMTSDEVLAIAGKKRVELPEAVAFALAERLWKVGVAEAPPGELHFVMHPWVVDNAKLKAAGWTPGHGNQETLTEAIEAHRPWIAVGRARMRKDDLAKSAAAMLGVVGALGLVRRSRKRSKEG